jgi:threonine dehydrogenase-like Zn-dependent dehydrogenase
MKMMALSWNAPERMDWEERDVPQPEAGEVLIRVEAVGICGSEIEGYLGHNSLRVPPLVMGHEFCGTIEQAGAGVSPEWIGRRVTVNPLLTCGRCPACQSGRVMLCKERKLVGVHRPGAFGQWVAVPESAVHPVPADMNPYRAALTEPLACSLRAARRAMEESPFANVLVFGAGGIGLLSAMTARILGASGIMIADTNNARLDMALSLGFDHAVNPREQSLEARIREAFGDRGVDVIIDAAGFQPTREAAMRVVNPGGTIMNIGLGIDDTTVPINVQIRNEIRILGSFCYSRQDFRDALALLVSGKITEEGWTEIRPMSQGAEAFSDLTSGRVVNGKIFLDPGR